MNLLASLPPAGVALGLGAVVLLGLQWIALRGGVDAACRAAALAGLGLLLAAWELALLSSSPGDSGAAVALWLSMGRTRVLAGGAAALLGLPTALAAHRVWGLGSARAAVIAGIGVGVGPAAGLLLSGFALLARIPVAPSPPTLAVAIAAADRWVVAGAALGVATAVLLAVLPDRASARRQRYAGL